MQENVLAVRSYGEELCSFIRECVPPVSLSIQGGLDLWNWKRHLLLQIQENLQREGIFCQWFYVGNYDRYTGQGGDIPDFSRTELTNGFWEKLSAVGKDKKSVLMVDGLDALSPAVAVEILEYLKKSVSYENCVILLDVDREVVFQGIREKYGDSVSDREIKRQYDRLIPLTYRLPKALYQEQLAQELSHTDICPFYDKEWYFQAVYLLTEGSFRGVKRLQQAFTLMDRVAKSRGIYGEGEQEREKQKKCIFLLSGIQLNYPELYDHMTFSASFGFVRKLLGSEIWNYMGSVLGELHFPRPDIWNGWFSDVMAFFASLLEEYVGSGQNLEGQAFVRVEDICRLIRLDRGEIYIQPESGRNSRERKEGEASESSTLQERYLFDKMDQVFSCYFQKKDQNPWDRKRLEYRYYHRGEATGQNWLFGIRLSENEVFPTVYFRKELFWENPSQEGNMDYEELFRLQKNLSCRYRKLQEEYGKRAYGDQDFTGPEFLLYSEQQTNLFMEGILRMFKKDEILAEPLFFGMDRSPSPEASANSLTDEELEALFDWDF